MPLRISIVLFSFLKMFFAFKAFYHDTHQKKRNEHVVLGMQISFF